MMQQALELDPADERPRVRDTVREDILAALQLEELPPHLVDGEGRPRFPTKWPEHRDPAFIDAVVTGRPGGSFGPGPRDVHAINRAVFALVAEGKVVQDRLYLGATDPGSGNYRGWIPVFRLAGKGTGMTYKQRVIALLEAGGATTYDIALELYGSTDREARARAARLLWQVRADGVPVHSTRRIDNSQRYGQRLKVWELRA